MDLELFGTLCFALAVLHTFLVKWFQHIARGYTEGSARENFFHLLGEIEVVFGLWAFVFAICFSISKGHEDAIHYIESQNFTEPAFVFVIMVICATQPILQLATKIIEVLSKLLPLKASLSFYVSCLIIGPLLGSLITEPAAMTVTALILLERIYQHQVSQKLKYATLGLLFVNISIGGTLTPYAAPPVLMVAQKWNWDLSFMLSEFGWKAAVSIVVSTALVAFRFRKELSQIPTESSGSTSLQMPIWVYLSHVLLLALVVMSSHHMAVFVGLFLFFLGLVTVTQEYQSPLKIREGLMVAFFLAGLVVLGGQQRWWLEPLLTQLDSLPLYIGSTFLTAITDNAALTYLGSQVPTLSEASRYALVAGAVTGGGLTVIANAPNPAGYGILNPAFGPEGISPFQLFIHALIPTGIAAVIFNF